MAETAPGGATLVPPRAAVAAVRRFAAAHGGSATAVVQHLGVRGARIVLVGADGVWGDQVVDSVERGRAVCAAAPVSVVEAWDRELTAALRTPAVRRRRMGRGPLSR